MRSSDLLKDFTLVYCMCAGNGKIPENARRSTRSHSLNNSLWKRLWTSRKTHCVIIIIIIIDHDNDNGGGDEDDDDEDHDDNDGDMYMYST
jgi:hypothetical protein